MRVLCLLPLILFATLAHADAGLDAVADLGRINGLALACSQPEVAARAKELMLDRVPRLRTYGEAFEKATSEAYTRIPGGCPEAAALRVDLEVVATRLPAGPGQ